MTASLFDESDVKRSLRQAMRCRASMDRYRGHWENQKGQELSDWNPAMELAGKNYCSALVEFNKVAQIVHAFQPEAADIQKEALAELNALITEFEGLLGTKASDIGMGWRRDVMHAILGAANAAITEVKSTAETGRTARKPKKINLG